MYAKYEMLRKKHKKTNYRVAKDTGISQSTLSGWKHGRGEPKVDKLKILAEYFNVPIDYFL